MAQLNPNFEIDFSDINSYEQIQLINDTQLAKENLLMHRAYKEPSDDEIIKNHFSSFTFVDFCPRLFSKKPTPNVLEAVNSTLNQAQVKTLRYYELEKFSDLFDRINAWLKLNKDWRVVSMETLIFDCKSQFNHMKSSIYSNYLPKNTRGLRLFLSPSKSRFSGPQKIGCINVVPRKLSSSYNVSSRQQVGKDQQVVTYETLDQILLRLNELLLIRPIEGRILSVETISLPMVDGYVNTESNYFMDSRLNLLDESTYNLIQSSSQQGGLQTNSNREGRSHCLIDILRVYYEFGPMICGLVNLIDFVPRFYLPTPTTSDTSGLCESSKFESNETCESEMATSQKPVAAAEKIAATESLTRLVRRSLAWFEAERKRILAETSEQPERASKLSTTEKVVNLKLCNVQVYQKTMLKSKLVQINANNALQSVDTRTMAHQRAFSCEPLVCAQCSTSSAQDPLEKWCSHLLDLSQPFDLKFVRLAYVVPVYNRYVRSICPLRHLRAQRPSKKGAESGKLLVTPTSGSENAMFEDELDGSSSSLSSSSSATSGSDGASAFFVAPQRSRTSSPIDQEIAAGTSKQGCEDQNLELDDENLSLIKEEVEFVKQEALDIVSGSSERHRRDEEANQMHENDDGLNDLPIGQLTYRLFAPCQLVSSSSCFSINPVNSSSPLARRGSVDLNGSGISSENAHPSTHLLGTSPSTHNETTKQVVTSFGAFFPALTNEILTNSNPESSSNSSQQTNKANKYTTNEFETVDAIRRRMEIYVTTNSMKVIAGETLIVNLSDSLSCLSTAIEQTVVRSSFCQRRQSTWVSVYVLYAAVEEPQLPVQLMAQQKMRELSLIEEKTGEEEEEEEYLFEDGHFSSSNSVRVGTQEKEQQLPKTNNPNGTIRIEKTDSSSLILYNSAYERTVALPTQPDNHIDSLEPIERAEYLWLEDSEFGDVHLERRPPSVAGESGLEDKRRRRARKKKSKRKGSEESQCSIM